MKTFIAYAACLLMISGSSVYAQQDSTFSLQDSLKKWNIKFIVKTDLLFPAISLFEKRNTGSLTFETCFRNRHSVQFTVMLSILSTQNDQNKSIQFIPEYKYFIHKKKDYSGAYAGAYFKAIKYNYTTNYFGHSDLMVYDFGGGGLLGYHKYLSDHFVLDILIGFGYRVTTYSNLLVPDYYGPDGRIAINIGYKF